MAAAGELTVAAGLIYVKFVRQHWLRTTDVCRAGEGRLCHMQTKTDKGREGVKTTFFLDILYGWPINLLRSYLIVC